MTGMEDYRAAARLEGSKLTLLAPNAYREAMRLLPDGDYVVSVEPATVRRRSLAANRRYWLLLTVIAEQTGHEKEDLHAYFRQRFLTEDFTLVNADGEVIDDREVSKSTTTLSPEAFNLYVMQVEQVASETLGCEVLPEREGAT